MKTAAPLALVMLCQVPALAQPVNSVTVRLVHDDADGVIDVGETVSWTLWVEFEGYEEWQWLESAHLSLTASDDLATISKIEFDPYPAPQVNFGVGPYTTDSELDGASFTRLSFYQYHDFWHGPTPHVGSPLAVLSFETTAIATGELGYIIGEVQSLGDPNRFISIAQSVFRSDQYAMTDIAIRTHSLIITPAPPATLPLFAALGLATRRRRGSS